MNKNIECSSPQAGKGRGLAGIEIRNILEEYQEKTKEAKVNMDWEDYLNLIDIVTYINTNSGIDLAFKIGYMAGKEEVKGKIRDFLKDK